MLDSDPAPKRSSIRRRTFTGNTASTQGVLVQASQGLAARRFPRGAFNVGLHKLGWFFAEGSCSDANADKPCWLFCPGPAEDSTPSSCRIGRSSNVCPETLVCQLPSCSCEIHTGGEDFYRLCRPTSRPRLNECLTPQDPGSIEASDETDLSQLLMCCRCV